MRGFHVTRLGICLLPALALVLVLGAPNAASGNERGATASLGDLGERALEKLPWPAHIIRADLGRDRPVSVAGCYLMDQHLIVITAGGRITCLDQRNFEPRWVNSLKAPLARAPAEGPTHFVFLCKDHMGVFWAQSISKRSGTEASPSPVRLPYACSAGIDANGSSVFLASLGSPRSNKTLETVSLITGRRGWGYSSTGMLWADPRLDPDGDIVIIAGDDGVVTALPADASTPARENWIRDIGGSIRGTPAVTPEHVVVGNADGTLYCLNIFSGAVNWLQGLDEPIRTAPWVLGGYETQQVDTGVEGAASVERRTFTGLVFARNVKGLHCFDLVSGKPLFQDERGGKPVLRNGKWVVTQQGPFLTFRDATDGYKVVHSMKLGMFDLIPTNDGSNVLYACTHDGTLLAAVPK